MALSEICRELNNYFEYKDRLFGHFSIVGSTLTYEDGAVADYLQDGQYYRLVGSVFNDGVHVFSTSNPKEFQRDEEFTGAIWAMAIPPEFIALNAEIDAWVEKNADVLNSPFQSESFGGYSYTKASGGSTSGGITWQSAFAARLNKWRKIRCRF